VEQIHEVASLLTSVPLNLLFFIGIASFLLRYIFAALGAVLVHVLGIGSNKANFADVICVSGYLVSSIVVLFAAAAMLLHVMATVYLKVPGGSPLMQIFLVLVLLGEEIYLGRLMFKPLLDDRKENKV